MEFILILIVLAIGAYVVVRFMRARRERQDRAAQANVPKDPFAPEEDAAGDPRTLKAGDMVEYLGERLFVRGSLRLREGGYQWSEHFIDDLDGDRRWLSIEEDPDLEVVLWVQLKGTDLLPNAQTLTHEGVEYRRDEHGTANFTSEGTTGLGSAGRVEYADFEAKGGRYLSFEKFEGGEWEVALGERVPPGTLTVYPAGDA